MMGEFGFLSLGYRLLKDFLSWKNRKKRHLTPSELVKLRKKWKEEFESKLIERRKEGLRADIIVRDMKRMDNYPDIDENSKGISPWFRVGLMGTYHRGILVGLRWDTLTLENDNWRYTDHRAGEEGDIKVILIGYIPYENIEEVDWEGDEYYYFPHIYCHFDAKRKEPYDKLAFCEQKHSNDIPFYTEVAEYANVRKHSKK